MPSGRRATRGRGPCTSRRTSRPAPRGRTRRPCLRRRSRRRGQPAAARLRSSRSYWPANRSIFRNRYILPGFRRRVFAPVRDADLAETDPGEHAAGDQRSESSPRERNASVARRSTSREKSSGHLPARQLPLHLWTKEPVIGACRHPLERRFAFLLVADPVHDVEAFAPAPRHLENDLGRILEIRVHDDRRLAMGGGPGPPVS